MSSSCTDCQSTPGPACLDLNVYRGDDLTLPITQQDGTGAPIDLTGRTYAAQIRATPESTTAVSFGVAVNAPLGLVTLTLTDAQTANDVPLVGVWDLQEVNGTETTTLIRGKVQATKDVTA